MNKLKSLVLVAAVFAAFASLAATASATELYTESGMVTPGTTIAAAAEGKTILHPPIGSIECGASTVEGTTSNTGGATETVKGNISALTYTECNATVTVLKKGSLEIHTRNAEADGNGTLTSSGTEVTVVFAGFHCVFSTNNTDLGTLTSDTESEANATLDIEATIPRSGGSSGIFCGSTAAWTGSYAFTAPSTIGVDFLCKKKGPNNGDFTTREDCKKTKNYEPGKGEWKRYPV